MFNSFIYLFIYSFIHWFFKSVGSDHSQGQFADGGNEKKKRVVIFFFLYAQVANILCECDDKSKNLE